MSRIAVFRYGDEADAAYAQMKENRELLELPELWDAPTRYYEPLCKLAAERGKLTLRNLIDTVVRVNGDLEAEKAFADALAAVNGAARGDDAAATYTTLHAAPLGIEGMRDAVQSEHYSCNCVDRYHTALASKCADGDASRDDVQVRVVIAIDQP
jgi:hypothetical protein